MTIINVNSISGINSITAQGASGIEFYDSSGNSVHTVTSDTLTVGTGASVHNPASNVLTLGTNNEERIRINSTGHVGIGTDAPEGPCHILSNANALAILESSSTNSDLVQADPSGSTRIRNNSGELKIYTGGDASSHNAANSTLAATFDSSGNLAFPNGNGIDFSATAGSGIITNGGILDDYEEGTWTPGIAGGVSAGSYTLSDVQAYYTKIGNRVILTARFKTTVNSAGSGYAKITGLPFNYKASTRDAGSCAFRYWTTGAANPVSAAVQNNSSAVNNELLVTITNDNNSDYVYLPITGLGSATWNLLQFTYIYEVA